jgi:hypothetical protein
MPAQNDISLNDHLKAVLNTALDDMSPLSKTRNETALGFDFIVTRGDGEQLEGSLGYKPVPENDRFATAGLFFTVTVPHGATASSYSNDIEGGEMADRIQRLGERSNLVTMMVTMWFEQVAPTPHRHPRAL